MKKSGIVAWIGFNVIGLTGAAFAVSVASTDIRWIYSTAQFLLANATAIWSTISDRALIKRSRRLQSEYVRLGVTLRKPLWITFGEYSFLLSISATSGAIASAIGFPRIGAGIFFASAALFVLATRAGWRADDYLVFNKEGLGVQFVKLRFFVGWDIISGIQTVGPRHFQVTKILVKDRHAVINSVDPATPEARSRVASILGPGPEGTLVMTPWCGGLDGDAVVRFIHDAMAQST